jgi:hypothetical protein
MAQVQGLALLKALTVLEAPRKVPMDLQVLALLKALTASQVWEVRLKVQKDQLRELALLMALTVSRVSEA